MRSILLSLLQIVLVSGILYSYYHFFLRNKRFHQYNRFFLLAVVAFSILIPFLNIPVYFTEQEADSSFVLRTLNIVPDTGPGEEITGEIIIPEQSPSFDSYVLLYYAYISLSLFFLTRIIISLIRIRKLYRNNPVEKLSAGTDGDDIYFINTGEPGTPFSFFKWMFWNREIELQSEKGEQIFRHELFHIRQKHSWDIIFTELVTIIFWINPFFHIIKKELKAIHEFLADKYAANENGKWNYAELLLMQALHTNHSLVNPFFHNQIKRRIAMITSSNKPGHQYLRKILVLPLLALVAALFAFTYKATRDKKDTPRVEAAQPLVVVIDAGHGGIDPGAKSADGKFSESTFTLQLAKKIAELAPSYNIKVVLTRDGDQLPGNATTTKQGLINRLQIVEQNKADAFISLHLNANMPGAKSTSGFEAYVAKQSTETGSRQLGATVLQHLAGIYKTNEQLKMRSHDIYILEKSTTPSVIVECGSISDKEDLAFISKAANQEQVAKTILAALAAWANTDRKANPAPIPASANKIFADTPRIKPLLRVTAAKITMRSSNDKTEESLDASSPVSIVPDKLLIINGKKYAPQEAARFKQSAMKADEMIITPAGDEEAIKQYGEMGRNGVIELKNAVFFTPPAKTLETVNITGLSSVGAQPLIVIDGEVQLEADTVVWKKMPASSIESITVLKDKSATDIYGDKAKNGVIIITTKPELKEVTVVGKKIDRADATETTAFAEEVVVTGYATKKDVTKQTGEKKSLEEVTVVGKHNPQKVDEVVVTGYAKKKSDEVVVEGKQLPKKTDEVVVVGYATRKDDDKVFERVEIEAQFPGGHTALAQYLTRNLNASIGEENGAPAGTYTIFVQFMIDLDGNISDVKPLTNHGFGMEQEAIRVIKKGPNWIPAVQNGHKVKSYKKQPINFVIKGGKVTTQVNRLPEVVFVAYSSGSRANVKPGAGTLSETTPGSGEWRKFFERNIDGNVIFNQPNHKKQTTVLIKFSVEADGTISSIKAAEHNAVLVSNHAISTMRNIGKVTNNSNSRVWFIQPLTFLVEES